MEEKWYNNPTRGCVGLTEFFDYEEESRYNSEETRMLRRICNECPFKQECLEDALEYSDEYTFRAGMTPSERRVLMRAMGIPSWEEKQKAKGNNIRIHAHGFGKAAWFYGCKCVKCGLRSEHDIRTQKIRDAKRRRKE